MKTSLLVLASLVALVSCGDKDTGNEETYTRLALEVATQKARWASARPVSYQYVYEISCYCLYTDEVRITVTDQAITSVVRTRDSAALPSDQFSNYQTVDQVFARIERAIAQKAERITVNYDTTLGYPTFFSVDYWVAAADDESTTFISDLVAQ